MAIQTQQIIVASETEVTPPVRATVVHLSSSATGATLLDVSGGDEVALPLAINGDLKLTVTGVESFFLNGSGQVVYLTWEVGMLS